MSATTTTVTPVSASTAVSVPRTVGAKQRVAAALGEASAVTALLAVFTWIQNRLGTNTAAAHANADAVARLDGSEILGWEVSANTWLAGIPWLAALSALLYSVVLFAPPAVLAWAWWRDRAAYGRLRTMLVTLTFASLIPFALFPVAPPRLHVPGTVDIVERYRLLGSSTTPTTESAANLFAATPSLHVAWACWVAYAVWVVLRRRGFRPYAVWSFPVVAAADVVVTANHYLLDVFSGGLLALLTIAGVGAGHRWLARI